MDRQPNTDDGHAAHRNVKPGVPEPFDEARVAASVTPQQIAAWVAPFFRPLAPLLVRPLRGGSSKLTYRVRSGAHDAVLHVLPPTVVGRYPRLPADMAYEAAFSDALRLAGVLVPRRYDTPDGRCYVCAEVGEVRYWITLHDFVRGTTPTQVNEARRRALAQTLAMMHHVGRRLTLAPARMGDHNIGDQVALRELAAPPLPSNVDAALRPFLEQCQQVASAAWHQIAAGRQRVPRFPTHGDFSQRNAVFQGDTLAAVIDFDECHDDGAWADLALTMESACRPLAPARIEHAARTFLDHYQRRAGLDRPTFDLMVAFWRYRQATGGRTRLLRAHAGAEPRDQTLTFARRRSRTLTAIERLGRSL